MKAPGSYIHSCQIHPLKRGDKIFCVDSLKGVLIMFGLVPFGSKKNNEVAKKEDGFNSLFDVFNDSFFANPFAGFGDMPMTTNMKVDVKDNGDSYELIADLPGVDKRDIALNYDNNYLTIEAKKDESNDQKDDKGNYIRRERHTGTISRSFYIDSIDESKIEAQFEGGVLKVTLPKAPEVQRNTKIVIK